MTDGVDADIYNNLSVVMQTLEVYTGLNFS